MPDTWLDRQQGNKENNLVCTSYALSSSMAFSALFSVTTPTVAASPARH